jgi:hypothetical protein
MRAPRESVESDEEPEFFSILATSVLETRHEHRQATGQGAMREDQGPK